MTCLPKRAATGIPPFLANWAKARQCGGFTLQESAIYLRENSLGTQVSGSPAIQNITQTGLTAFTAVNEPNPNAENSDAENLNEEPTTESEAHIFATEDGAEETEPCEDDDATEDEEYDDAESEAPTQENTTDQNDNVTEAEKHEQMIPHPDVKDIEKLFQKRGWNEEEEEHNDE